MSVYYKKDKKLWYINVMVGGKRYYCYRKLGTDESFTSKKAALSYEPFFIAEVMGAKTKKEIPLNEVLFEAYYLYMKGKLKPSTYYGYVNTFQKHWLRHFKGLKPLLHRQ